MKLPDGVQSAVESTLEARRGRPVRVAEAGTVGGGCISPTARLRTEDGDAFFLKWSGSDLPDSLLAAEASGLRALGDTDTVRVPEILGSGGETDEPGWLLLEWIEPGPPSAERWEQLGRALAALHRSRAAQFGAERDNFIGSLPQANDSTPDWPEFWWDRRLEPQLRRAERNGLAEAEDRRRFQTLYERLPDLLAPAMDDGASLLHGDLWSGNVLIPELGPPALIDPSVYHGHREVDLAMADLFGGFPSEFKSAYRDSWPLAPGYTPVRRSVYQLYYLLVHVNLFGASYLRQTRRALAEAGV